MDTNDHHSFRPPFLRRGTGIIDSLYQVWLVADDLLNKAVSSQPSIKPIEFMETIVPDAPEPLLPYVSFVDENIVCVRTFKKTGLIEPFCTQNNITADDLYISVTREGYIGLKRDVLEKLIAHAIDIFVNIKGDQMQNSLAADLIADFAFLDEIPNQTEASTPQLEPIAPYKVDAPWERHLR
jgi:hypothetical protein